MTTAVTWYSADVHGKRNVDARPPEADRTDAQKILDDAVADFSDLYDLDEIVTVDWEDAVGGFDAVNDVIDDDGKYVSPKDAATWSADADATAEPQYDETLEPDWFNPYRAS